MTPLRHIRYPYSDRLLCGARLAPSLIPHRSTADWLLPAATCRRCVAKLAKITATNNTMRFR